MGSRYIYILVNKSFDSNLFSRNEKSLGGEVGQVNRYFGTSSSCSLKPPALEQQMSLEFRMKDILLRSGGDMVDKIIRCHFLFSSTRTTKIVVVLL